MIVKYGFLCEAKMKFLNPENMRLGKFNDIFTRKKSYLYEFQFSHKKGHITQDMPRRPTKEMMNWLHENVKGDYSFIREIGELWGISFQKKKDAMLYRIRWE